MLMIMLSTAAVTQCSEGKKMQEKEAEEANVLKPGRGLGMGPLGLRARAMAAEAAAKGKEVEEEAAEKGKEALSKVKQAPPLPPKRATRTTEAQAAAAERPEHEESWYEMMSRHASTLASHLGAD